MTSAIATLLLTTSSVAVAEPRDLTVTAGWGVTKFADPSMRTIADEGAGWDARVGYRIEPLLTIEAVYAGSLHSIDTPEPPSHASLLGTGVDIDLRVGMRYVEGVEPYFFGGLGWAQYRLTGTTNVSMVDNVQTVPLGLGVSFHRGPIVVDLRAAYRGTAWVDVFHGAIDNALATWSFTLGVGLSR